MKQYLTPDQTAKLIELGFEKPTMKNIPTPDGVINEEWYSIGELLSFLPRKIYRNYNYYGLSIFNTSQGWYVLYAYFGDGFMWTIKRETKSTELIDAIFEMLIKLKEEGVI